MLSPPLKGLKKQLMVDCELHSIHCCKVLTLHDPLKNLELITIKKTVCSGQFTFWWWQRWNIHPVSFPPAFLAWLWGSWRKSWPPGHTWSVHSSGSSTTWSFRSHLDQLLPRPFSDEVAHKIQAFCESANKKLMYHQNQKGMHKVQTSANAVSFFSVVLCFSVVLWSGNDENSSIPSWIQMLIRITNKI